MLAVLILALPALSASAAVSPLQVGVLPFDDGESSIQLVSHDTPVVGVRLNLPASLNTTVVGLDLGFISFVHDFTGISLNVVASDLSHCRGIALAFFDSATTLEGIQLAAIAAAEDVRGIQAGAMTYSDCGSVNGLQLGLLNIADDLCGLQIGLVNTGRWPLAEHSTDHGVQIGLVNAAGSLRGVQLGLLNFDTSSSLSCLPLLRVSV